MDCFIALSMPLEGGFEIGLEKAMGLSLVGGQSEDMMGWVL